MNFPKLFLCEQFKNSIDIEQSCEIYFAPLKELESCVAVNVVARLKSTEFRQKINIYFDTKNGFMMYGEKEKQRAKTPIKCQKRLVFHQILSFASNVFQCTRSCHSN